MTSSFHLELKLNFYDGLWGPKLCVPPPALISLVSCTTHIHLHTGLWPVFLYARHTATGTGMAMPLVWKAPPSEDHTTNHLAPFELNSNAASLIRLSIPTSLKVYSPVPRPCHYWPLILGSFHSCRMLTYCTINFPLLCLFSPISCLWECNLTGKSFSLFTCWCIPATRTTHGIQEVLENYLLHKWINKMQVKEVPVDIGTVLISTSTCMLVGIII